MNVAAKGTLRTSHQEGTAIGSGVELVKKKVAEQTTAVHDDRFHLTRSS